MNSRQRALMAINHQEPDRIPLDLGSTIVTSITRTAYDALRAYLQIAPEPEPVISHRQMDTVYPNEDLLQLYQIDFRTVYMKGPWYFKVRELPEEEAFYDEYNMKWRKASFYYDVVERPLANIETVADIDHAHWPDPRDPGRVAGIREEARRLWEKGDHLVIADIMCLGPFEGACFLRGYEAFLTDLYLNPKLAEAVLDKILEIDIALWDVFLDAVGDNVDVVAQGDDVGMQTGTYISPKMYRQFIKPRHQSLFSFIRTKTKAKIFLHSCGSVYDVIPDLIEAGVQILNPLQRSAAKMDIAVLKKEFGRDLCFWGGGIDVQQVLPYASHEQIENEVKYSMETLGPGGGFVFVASHNIQADVTADRIHKLYESALKYR